MERISRIRKNSDELNVLHRRIHETFNKHYIGQESDEAWRQACREFHDSFDRLFFPGGSEALRQALRGQPEALLSAVDFLVADPVHHRSGYLKEGFWRKAPRWQVSSAEKARIESAALAYLEKQIRRDFWYMCRAMARMGSASFWQQVTLRMCSSDELVAKRASWLFSYSLGVDAGEQVRQKVRYEALRKKYGYD